jgi:hypothetical protein
MKTDILKQYVSARRALLREKARLEARSHQINQALAEAPAPPTVTPKRAAPTARRTRSPISMRAAVIRATAGHPLTKPEILAAIQELGFRSTSKKPARMLDNLLYGRNPRFKNDQGRFSPLGAIAGSSRVKPVTKTAKPSGKHKMTAAGRAKLSALIKARWAKIKKAGGKKLRAL